jgi:1-acyl-sn-glycerol-3-phosphate acyltransferase
MKHIAIYRWLIGFLIPIIFIVLVISIPFAIYNWDGSLYEGLYMTLFLFGMLIIGVSINLYTAWKEIERHWVVKIFFTCVSGALFLPIYIFIMVLGLILGYTFSVKKKLSKYGCYVVTFLSSVACISMGIFLFGFGDIKSYQNSKKKITVMNHRASPDYPFSSILGGYSPYRIMIGANLWKWPVFRKFFDMVGLPIYREEENSDLREAAVRKTNEVIEENEVINILIFSESTRSEEDGLVPFKKGAFVIAKRKNLLICPVIFLGSDKIRKPTKRGPKSYKGVKKEYTKISFQSAYKFISGVLKVIFKEGINPGIVIRYHLPPIDPQGKDVEEIKDEVWNAMNNEYIRISTMKYKILQLFAEDLLRNVTKLA